MSDESEAREFDALGMSPDEAIQVRDTLRGVIKEHVNDAVERVGRGEQMDLRDVAKIAVTAARAALVDRGLSLPQREFFLMIVAIETLKAYLAELERTATKRRVN